MDSILFDLDGTMWDTTAAAAKIWTDIITRDYPQITDTVTAEKLRALYGLPLVDIARKIFLSVPQETGIAAMRTCVREQCPYLARHGGILLGSVENTLKELAGRYRLFIISNCEDGYIESFLTAHKLWDFFTDFECPGKSGLLKAENIRLICKRHNLKSPVYVGDTAGDEAAAKEAGVPFVFAAYGFGTVSRYDYRIERFEDLALLF